MRRVVVLAMVCCVWHTSLVAQLSLEEYRRRVEQYSFALSSAEWEVARSEAEWRKARKGYLPRLDVGGDFRVNFRRQSTSEKPYTYGLSPILSGRIYDGGATQASVGMAKALLEKAQSAGEFTSFEVRYVADYAYWNMLATHHLSLVQEYYTRIVRSLKEVVQTRFDDGYIGKGDLLMVETQLNDAIYQQMLAEQTAQKAQHNFNVLMGESPDAEWTPTDSLSVLVPTPRRIPIDSVLARRSDLQMAMSEVERASWAVKGAGAPYNPQITFDVVGTLAPTSPNTANRLRVDGGAGVSLSVPVFAWGERRQAVRSAKAAMMQSVLAVSDLRDQIEQQEADAWSDVTLTRREVEQNEASLAIATENLELATFSYSEGETSVLDVLSAQLSWIQLYTNAIAARLAYRDAVAQYLRVAQWE
ncbi:MAG: TolC family protein [Rikenellaceae bacterium]|nr:TolC family protein [Rikenellaceae bacterium]